ncbi:MAG TPA: hypothetical protein VNF71_00960 [Acidimicrobiales bacterium]|nr:hypothetical protein [Acidimicrobiales bacterium]
MPPDTSDRYFIDLPDVGEIVALPGGHFPKRATALYGEDGLHLEVIVGVRDELPRVLRLTVIPDDEAGAILAPRLRQARWQQIFERIIAHAGMAAAMRLRHLSDHPPGPSERTLTFEEEQAAKDGAVGPYRRRPITDSLLRQTAAIYMANRYGAPTRAVHEQLFTSHRNATRWIAEARKRGFITEED